MFPRYRFVSHFCIGVQNRFVIILCFARALAACRFQSMKRSHPDSLRFLCATLLLGALCLCPLPALTAEAPPKGETIADLHAATDQAVRKWSLGITSAFDDLIQSRWANPTVAESRAEGVQQMLQELAARALQQAGPPLPREFEYLGSLRTGSHNVRLCYLIRHAWSHYPLELGFLFVNNQWRMTDLRVAGAAQRLSTRFLQAEPAAHLRFDPASDPGSLKPATLSDLKHASDAVMANTNYVN